MGGDNIFLIGFRGAGKSSVGRLLAARTGRAFRDMDGEIERREGLPIQAIVAGRGWDAFRRLEAALLEEICRGGGQVVSTGGGVVLDPQNVVRMQAGGRVVWLTAAAATVLRRISDDPASAAGRPPLTPGAGRLEEIPALLAERTPLYRAAAHAAVCTDDRSPAEVCRLVCALLKDECASALDKRNPFQ
jgi:shikimate kinase